MESRKARGEFSGHARGYPQGFTGSNPHQSRKDRRVQCRGDEQLEVARERKT